MKSTTGTSFNTKLLFFILFSQAAGAVECPVPHPKYNELLSQLDGLVNAVKADAQCKGMAKDFTDLRDIYAKGNRDLIDKAFNLKPGTIHTNPSNLNAVGADATV